MECNPFASTSMLLPTFASVASGRRIRYIPTIIYVNTLPLTLVWKPLFGSSKNKSDWYLFSASQSHSHLFRSKSNPSSSISIYLVAATTMITISVMVLPLCTVCRLTYIPALQLLGHEDSVFSLLLRGKMVHTYLSYTISTICINCS